jgi:hypothetical protein
MAAHGYLIRHIDPKKESCPPLANYLGVEAVRPGQIVINPSTVSVPRISDGLGSPWPRSL